MKCPKCQLEQKDQNISCEQCGIVFSKYFKYHPSATQAKKEEALEDNEALESHDFDGITWKDRLLYPGDKTDAIAVYVRFGLLVILTIWGLRLIFASISSNTVGESFLHLINLPFHEAGHVIFRPLGQFVASLGGTLGQLLMPLICLFVLLIKHHNTYGAAVCGWWFGENFLDIAPYINDARAGQLPLLGGNFGHSAPYGFHDWEYLLTEMGLLRYDHSIAQASHWLGSIIMIASLSWASIILYKQLKLSRQ
ncbi:zinc ribbon domain-containing protein [Spartinivicinus ruber]|uniref:zinc ribbon domain-containing protein n=1 Tax=Spartinivicinus ruber TaxID=2683272 RepID=UPI0013D33436|nr:zinc ribbon domain-containing protein [Spartinivicinus ruber]